LSEAPLLLTTPGNPIFHTPYDALIYRPNVILSLGLKKSSPGTNNDFLKILAEKWDGWLHIFTDASKLTKEGYVGSAVWIPQYKIVLSYKSPPLTSVFTGEAIALYEAVSFIESHKIAKVVIFSDSLSCLQDLVKCPLRSRDNLLVTLKTREVLHRCDSLGLEVVLAWVPSHSGIEGNEQADACAKQAIDIGDTSHSGCHSQDLRASAKTHLTEQWSEEWNITRLSKGRHYGGIQPDLPVRPWFFKFQKACKTATSTIIRLRLGHICSPSFLAKIRVRDHSLCECGLEEGTADHIFFNCPKTSSSLYDFLPDYIHRPANLSYILSFVNTSFVYILAKFINKFKIKQ
jgi:ribonuclease HI